MKKILSLLLALSLVMGLSVTAFADDETVTISVASNDTHSYDVYQIFVGELAEDGETLSNVKWGKNSKPSDGGVIGAAVPKTELDKLTAVNGASDTAKLAVIEEIVDLTGTPYGEVSKDKALENVPTGYYLLVDKGTVGENDSYSLYVVQVVGPTVVDPKRDTVTVEKKVIDKNDTSGQTSDWQDSADHDLNDVVDFKITATLPSNLADYDKYKVVFTDTMSKGLTLIAEKDGYDVISGFTIKIGDGAKLETGYTITAANDEQGNTVIVITIDDVKILGAEADDEIVITYQATLNKDAVLGEDGNPNKVKLNYSNNPNTGHENEMGTTPEDKVIVFTYKVDVDKVHQTSVDSAGNPIYEALDGAGFTLYKNVNGTWVEVSDNDEDEGNEVFGGTNFVWTHLDDGDYKLVETTTPNGYNTIQDIEFTISAEHTEEADDPKLTALTGDAKTGDVFTPNLKEGSLSADVVNQKGNVLPETGGIGTTIFYVLGAVMVIGAGVLLIAKKRMSNEG